MHNIVMMGPVIVEFGEKVTGATYIPRPGAYAVLFDAEGRVAVVRFKDRYYLPGGGIKHSETPQEALAREVCEETGKCIAILDKIGEANQYVFAPQENAYWQKFSMFFTAKITIDHRDPLDDRHELRWFAPEEAVKHLHHASHAWAVQEAIKHRV
jgi:8-oxo-dGTP diphosphatase